MSALPGDEPPLVVALRAVPAALLAVSLALGVVVGGLVHRSSLGAAEQRFELSSEEALTTLRQLLERAELTARAASVVRDPELTQPEWEDRVTLLGLDPPLPGLVAINSLSVVTLQEAPRYQAQLRDAVGRQTAIFPRPLRERMVVIERVAPLDANEDALGFDVLTNPTAADAVLRALDEGRTALSDGLTLVQAPDGGTAVVLYTPRLLGPGARPGIGNVALLGQGLVDGVARQVGSVTLRVEDPTPEGVRLVGVTEGHDPQAVFRDEVQLEVYGQTWDVEIAAAAGSVSTAEQVAGPLGGLATALLAMLALLTVGAARTREEHAQSIAQERTADLREANEALRDALRVKDDFVAVVSHELRTPLTVIRGFAMTLREHGPEMSSADRSRALERIEAQSERLDQLVGELLVAARIQAGGEPVRREALPLRDAVVQQVEASASPQGVRVEVAPDLLVLVDPAHLARILDNLLTNAGKYGLPPVVVSAERAGARVQLCVRDHGEGVPEDLQERVFERFAQAEHDTRRTTTGVGLGLAIVRELAGLNGGRIWVEDAAPGARFVLSLLGVGAGETPPDEAPARHGRFDGSAPGVVPTAEEGVDARAEQ